ncbi:hypothetical protein ACJRO7_024997 [Eucalyptus globulus]|uniref:Uncharacterized protein n=1 Tax=Eucalyptus globulus TaxID=34317 RepID=A0ABD3KG19_EUCGL
MLTFGHRRPRSCGELELSVFPFSPSSKAHGHNSHQHRVIVLLRNASGFVDSRFVRHPGRRDSWTIKATIGREQDPARATSVVKAEKILIHRPDPSSVGISTLHWAPFPSSIHGRTGRSRTIKATDLPIRSLVRRSLRLHCCLNPDSRVVQQLFLPSRSWASGQSRPDSEILPNKITTPQN